MKWLVFLVVTFFVLWPNPWQFSRHLSHLGSLDAMVEPDAPQLAAWDDELRQRLEKTKSLPQHCGTGVSPADHPQTGGTGVSPVFHHGPEARATGEARATEAASATEESRATEGPATGSKEDAEQATNEARRKRVQPPPKSPAWQAQREVQKFVLEKVKYKWDWDTWGAADYMPTVAEMFAQAAERSDGQLYEDCDGRAVIAASLMRRLGYQADVVTDLRHVWVTTPQGEWMGPGGRKTLVSTPQGNRLDLRTAWQNVPASLSFGISVFPLFRELVILLTAYVLMLHKRTPWRAAALAGLLLIQGLLFMRCGVLSPQSLLRYSPSWPATVGLLHLLAGFTVLWWTTRRAHRKAARERHDRSPS